MTGEKVLWVVLLAGLFDLLLGEPPALAHPVVWMGKLISFFEGRRPHGHPVKEWMWGCVTVMCVVTVSAAVARGISWASSTSWWGLFLEAYALKTLFSLRGLLQAGRDVQIALESDTEAARDRLKALVSRSRNLDPPQIVSAAVESLAENITDSVLAPLMAFALFGLPGAAIYRAINTMDSMIGYRGDYEYFGKAAARLDDLANWIPARLAGVILCFAVPNADRRRDAFEALARDRRLVASPNAGWTMAPMAGALQVQLEKVGHYRLGIPGRPLTAGVIAEARALTGRAGAACIVLSGILAAVRGVW